MYFAVADFFVVVVVVFLFFLSVIVCFNRNVNRKCLPLLEHTLTEKHIANIYI